MEKRRIYMGLGMLAILIPLTIWTFHRIETTRKANQAESGLIQADEMQYQTNTGFIFGTSYQFVYASNVDLEQEILARLKEFDGELSMFNPESTIAKINRSEEVETGELFETMFETAMEVSRLTAGAFDITVAPMVNAWGFGTKGKAQNNEIVVRGEEVNVDSLKEIVGYDKVTLENHHLRKTDERVMLDASAIAKGYACDVVAKLLAKKGCTSYLVDIGGEIVAHGGKREWVDGRVQRRGWGIGITKPTDDPEGINQENQRVVRYYDIALATSGNYRQFYQDGAVRRSHTIDPRSGYPIQHQLLSATVTASSCMRADALATSAMVMGENAFIELVEQIADAECYLIVAAEDGLKEMTSSGWKTEK